MIISDEIVSAVADEAKRQLDLEVPYDKALDIAVGIVPYLSRPERIDLRSQALDVLLKRTQASITEASKTHPKPDPQRSSALVGTVGSKKPIKRTSRVSEVDYRMLQLPPRDRN